MISIDFYKGTIKEGASRKLAAGAHDPRRPPGWPVYGGPAEPNPGASPVVPGGGWPRHESPVEM